MIIQSNEACSIAEALCQSHVMEFKPEQNVVYTFSILKSGLPNNLVVHKKCKILLFFVLSIAAARKGWDVCVSSGQHFAGTG